MPRGAAAVAVAVACTAALLVVVASQEVQPAGAAARMRGSGERRAQWWWSLTASSSSTRTTSGTTSPSFTPSVTASTSLSPSQSPSVTHTPVSPTKSGTISVSKSWSASPGPVTYAAVALVCGNGVCESTWEGYGETCGTCPADCGPCQLQADVTACALDGVYALSFDDGPSKFTTELLQTLTDYNITANFFLVGQNIAPNLNVFFMEGELGHRQFSKTYTDLDVPLNSVSQLFTELQRTTQTFLQHSCERPTLWRPPFGYLDDIHRELATKLGMRAVLWNLNTLDSQLAADNPVKMTETFKTNLGALYPTSVLPLEHDATLADVNGVAAFLDYALSLEYKFVTLDECIWGKNYQLMPSWLYSQGLCPLSWSNITTELFPGVPCPVTEWSEWSPCNAQCGPGQSTRVRYTYPPENEFTDPACEDVPFTQLRTCEVLQECPLYVFNNSYAGPENSNFTVGRGGDISPYVSEGLSKTFCGFTAWRWANATVACSKPCGLGTQVRIRDFSGSGEYSFLCGPMTQVVLCQLQPCTTKSDPFAGVAHALVPVVGVLSGTLLVLILVGVVVWIRTLHRVRPATRGKRSVRRDAESRVPPPLNVGNGTTVGGIPSATRASEENNPSWTSVSSPSIAGADLDDGWQSSPHGELSPQAAHDLAATDPHGQSPRHRSAASPASAGGLPRPGSRSPAAVRTYLVPLRSPPASVRSDSPTEEFTDRETTTTTSSVWPSYDAALGVPLSTHLPSSPVPSTYRHPYGSRRFSTMGSPPAGHWWDADV